VKCERAAERGPKLVTILATVLLLGGMLPQLAWDALAVAANAVPTGGGPTAPRYFSQTGHYLSGRFRQFWESRGRAICLRVSIDQPVHVPEHGW
jgi:hypothetical protein